MLFNSSRLDLVAQEIDAVIHAPQLARFRVPAEADGVAQALAKMVRDFPSGETRSSVAFSGLLSLQALQVEPTLM